MLMTNFIEQALCRDSVYGIYMASHYILEHSHSEDDTLMWGSTVCCESLYKAHKLIQWAFDCNKSKNSLFAVSRWQSHISVLNPIIL